MRTSILTLALVSPFLFPSNTPAGPISEVVEHVEKLADEQSMEISQVRVSHGQSYFFHFRGATMVSALQLTAALERSEDLGYFEIVSSQPAIKNGRSEVTVSMSRQTSVEEFVAWARPLFESLPDTATIEFEWFERDRGMNTYLSIAGLKSAPHLNGSESRAYRIVIAAVVQPEQIIEATIYRLSESESQKFKEEGVEVLSRAKQMGKSVPLQQFTWQFFDPRSEKWQEISPLDDQLPPKIKLTIAEKDEEPETTIFELP